MLHVLINSRRSAIDASTHGNPRSTPVDLQLTRWPTSICDRPASIHRFGIARGVTSIRQCSFSLPGTSEGSLTSRLNYLPVLYRENAMLTRVPAEMGQEFKFCRFESWQPKTFLLYREDSSMIYPPPPFRDLIGKLKHTALNFFLIEIIIQSPLNKWRSYIYSKSLSFGHNKSQSQYLPDCHLVLHCQCVTLSVTLTMTDSLLAIWPCP